MITVIVIIGWFIYACISMQYIHKLHLRLRAHEQSWKEIEQLTDHNKDGDVVVHCKHLDKSE